MTAAQRAAARPRSRAAPACGLEALDPESGQTGQAESGEEHEPVVQREGKSRQPGRRVEKDGKARAVGEARDHEGEEDRPAARAWPRVGHRQERQRKQHGARVTERHSGTVVSTGLDVTLSVDPVDEREKVGKQPPRGLGQRHGLPGGASRDGLAAGAVLGGVRDRLEKREELGARQQERERPGGQGRADRPGGGRAAPPKELPREIHGPRRDAVKERLRMPAAEREPQGSGRQSDRAAPGLARETAQPEQQERKRRRRGPHAPAVPEQEIRREAPADRPGQSRPLAEVEVAKEEVARKQPEKQRERARERPGERHRKPDGDPRRRMQNARLRGPEEGVAREDEPVPERQAAFGQRLPDGRPPREVREREVREDRVPGRARRLRRDERLPRVGGLVEVRRAVELPEEHRFAGEDERQESDQQRRPRRNGGHEAASQPHGQRRRARIGQPQTRNCDSQMRWSSRVILAGHAGPERKIGPWRIPGKD